RSDFDGQVKTAAATATTTATISLPGRILAVWGSEGTRPLGSTRDLRLGTVSLGGAVGPGGDANAVTGTVGEDPGGRGAGIVDDAPAGRQGGGQAMLGVFARDRDIDVHRVPQGFGGVEVLHPDRRAVPEWVDGVVVGQFGVPEHCAPEADID